MKYNTNEIVKVTMYLTAFKIPYELMPLDSGLQLMYPNSQSCVYSVLQTEYTYGRKENVLEIADTRTPNCVSVNQTAEDVAMRIINHYWEVTNG